MSLIIYNIALELKYKYLLLLTLLTQCLLALQTGIKMEVEVKKEPDAKPELKSPPVPPPQKVSFTPEELKTAMMPPLMKMYNQEPEAIPFRTPVDPQTLNIPDYFEIVKKPMDMSTIKRKLDSGQYKDPWEVVDDVWLMFENAWIYNRKTSRVYKYCSKVSGDGEVLFQ